MAYRTRHWRVLPPPNSTAFVTGAVAYPVAPTYDTFKKFSDSAPDGALGIYVVGTGALVTGATNADKVAAGTKYQIAFKRNGLVELSEAFDPGRDTISKQAYVAPAKEVWTINATGIAVAAGDVLDVFIIDETTGNIPYPSKRYQHVVTAGQTLNQAIASLRTAINNPKLPQNRDQDGLVDATGADPSIILTAKHFGMPFKVIVGEKLSAAAVTRTTPLDLGSGSPEQVLLYEKGSDIFKGAKHMHHNAEYGVSQPADFGLPVTYTDSTKTYWTFHIQRKASEVSPTPKHVHYNNQSIYIFCPVAATTPYASLNNALGLG